MVEKEVIRSYALKNAVEHSGKAVEGSVLASLFAENLSKDEVKGTMPIIQEVVKEVNTLPIEEQKKQYELIKSGLSKREVRPEGELPPLENATNVVMRFAPFPSGPLHIGNTRQLILNDEYAKKYGGKLILVMDDTIGSKEKPILAEAYKLIEDGVKWLGVNYDKKIIYKSDRIEIYYGYAKELLKKGYMYTCSCSQENFQKLKKEKKDCPCRNKIPEEHLKNWGMMISKKVPAGTMVVRLKTSMQDPNPAFRDRVMFKISEIAHPRTKDKYRVYPSMEFSWAIDDHLLGISHIIRGADLLLETKVEKFIWDIFKWKHPEVIHTGFLSIEGINISKSKGAKEVKSGEYIGWNDPRLWSLQSLKDRGIKPEAVREFIKKMGITKVNSVVPVGVLYSINKRLYDNPPHYFFVENPMKITISGAPKIKILLPIEKYDKKKYREHDTMQEFYLRKEDALLLQNKRYRLMDLLTFEVLQTSPVESKHFSFVSQEKLDKVQDLVWIPSNEKYVSVKIVMPDFSVKKGIAEEDLRKIKDGEVVYFEQVGICKLVKRQLYEYEFWMAHP